MSIILGGFTEDNIFVNKNPPSSSNATYNYLSYYQINDQNTSMINKWNKHYDFSSKNDQIGNIASVAMSNDSKIILAQVS
jgi:hypothetical protein